MPSTISSIRPLSTVPGVQPGADQTPFNTDHYIESRGIRFRNDTPEKVGGFRKNVFDRDETILGIPRSCYSLQINGKSYTMIGTEKRLYAKVGSQITNITPLDHSRAAIVGATLASDYRTLASNPITTVSGSSPITITDANASLYKAGDTITLSGFSGVGGIAAGAINGTHKITAIVDATHYKINTSTAATSSATGGGASCVVATGKVKVISAAHGLVDGDRVKIYAATAFAGILVGQINAEFIIRNVLAGSFEVFTDGTATSSTTTGGGAAAAYDPPITNGIPDVQDGRGFGVGRFGVGLFGTSKTSTSGKKYPRIWCFDRYGDYLLCSPGNQGLLYEWAGSLTTAPTQVANSPNGINWFFVSNNIIVTLGAEGVENRIKTSDQNGRTVWTATAENQVYDDSIEGAGRFISQMNVRGVNLLFTEKQVYTFEYIGFTTATTTNVWKNRLLGIDCGIAGPMARIEANGIGYWIGQQNFYFYRGGNCEIIPSNTQKRATNQRYVFKNMSTGQRYKSFAWHNEPFEEINFHYPSATYNEVDSVSRFNITDFTWTNDTIDRVSAEVPSPSAIYPLLCSYDGSVYSHEVGTDADGDSLSFRLTTNRKNAGKKEARLSAFIPDCSMTGIITVTINGYQWPQSQTPNKTQTFTITPTTGRVEITFNCRYWTYTIEGDALGQSFSMGTWQEELQESGDGK